MKSLFEFNSYKELVLARISSMPKGGRGELRKIAAHLKMHTTRMSHALRGDEHLTLEQASSLAAYFGFSDLESEYFVALVSLERAGNEDLRRMIRRQLSTLREKSQQLVHRLPTDRMFSEEEKAIFYSNWYYSGIRILTSLKGYDTIDAIAQRFDLPRQLVKRVLEFLVSTGLCLEKDGRYEVGPQKTHIEADHPMASRLHANWRLLALTKHSRLKPHELAFTAPMSVQAEDLVKIRTRLLEAIQDVVKIPPQAHEPDRLACLTMDWFEF